MDMSLYKKIISEVKDYVISVHLSYFGEPLINPSFFDYVRYAKENGLKVGFYSNGIALKESIIDEIADNNVDEIFFSIDSLPNEYKFYAKMKNIPEDNAKKHLERVIAGIELLCNKIKQKHLNIKIVVIRMDSPEGTPSDIYDNFWRKKGVIPVSGGVIDWGGEVKRVEVTRNRLPIIECHFPYDLAINSDGTVGLCCIDFNSKIKLGDAKRESIAEIYNGDEIKKIRRKLAIHDYESLPCKNCRYEDFSVQKYLYSFVL